MEPAATGQKPKAGGQKPKSGWLNLAVDYGPIVVFFATYKHFAPDDRSNALGEVAAVVNGTASFMVAAVIALIVSKWKLGRISPMLWLSTGLIVGFGALTIFLHDPIWIQRKPTAIYLLFGTALLAGVWRGKALLKVLLEAAFEGLSDEGWMKLSRNWGWFFFALAAFNEALRHYLSFGDWIAAKLWLFMPLTFLFTFAHIPMLLRHGLAQDATAEVLTDPPHE
jgi:intracellular septation protein